MKSSLVTTLFCSTVRDRVAAPVSWFQCCSNSPTGSRENSRIAVRLPVGLRLGVLLVAGFCVWGGGVMSTRAAIVADWDTTGLAGTEATLAAAVLGTGVSSGVIGRGGGLTTAGAANSFNSAGWEATTASTTTDEYISFTLSLSSTYDLSTLSFASRSSGTGPGTLGLFYSGDAYTTPIASWAQANTATLEQTIDLSSMANFTGTLEFRIIEIGNLQADGSGATASGGTFRIQDKLALGVIRLGGNIIVASANFIWDDNAGTVGTGGTGGNFSDGNWTSDADGLITTGVFTDGSTFTFAAGLNGTGSYSVGMDVAVNASGLSFEEGNVTLAAGAGTLTLTVANVSVSTGATATIEEPILGAVGLGKTGDGTLTLSGNNDYTGTTIIGGGIVSIATDDNLGDVSADIALGGGTLQSTASISLDAGRDLSGTGTLAPASGTTLTFNGAVSVGAVTVSDTGTVALAAAAGTKTVTGLSFTSPGTVAVTGVGLSLLGGITTTHTSGTATVSGDVDFGTGTRTISVADGSAATDLLLSGNLSGASVLAKVGLGTLSLTGDNSGLTGTGSTPASIRQGGAGATPTAGGTISFDNANALGTGQLQLNGGTLRNDSGTPLVITNANGISTGAQDHANTPGGLVFAGSDMEFTGGVALFKATGATYQHMITVNNTTTFSGVFGPSTGSGTSTGLTVAGTGKLVLSGAAANTFTEAVTVGDGVTAGTILEAAKGGALALNTGITVNDGGTLLLSGMGDRINDAASLTLAGGTFSLDSLLLGMESLGALILMADSAIDFGGSGSNNTLTFAGLELNGFTLSIRNWSGPYYEYGQNDGGALTDQDRLLFSSDVSGENLAALRFYDDTNTFLNSGQQISFIAGGQFEIVPIPEPTTILGALGLLGLVGFRERRRLATLISRFALQTRV